MRVLTCSSIRRATASTRIVRLDLNGTPFIYQSGQAAWLGVADQALRMPYSIASAPEESIADGQLEFLIKLEADGAWGTHLQGLHRGSRVAVDGPFGTFVFPQQPEERAFLFVAGGTGIAPLRSMIRHAVLGRVPGRRCLLFSARTPHDFAYLPEIRGMARKGELELALTATREVPPAWRGQRGRITSERLAALIEDADGTLCFVCGPTAMVHDVPVMLQGLGVRRERIRVEEW